MNKKTETKPSEETQSSTLLTTKKSPLSMLRKLKQWQQKNKKSKTKPFVVTHSSTLLTTKPTTAESLTEEPDKMKITTESVSEASSVKLTDFTTKLTTKVQMLFLQKFPSSMLRKLKQWQQKNKKQKTKPSVVIQSSTLLTTKPTTAESPTEEPDKMKITTESRQNHQQQGRKTSEDLSKDEVTKTQKPELDLTTTKQPAISDSYSTLKVTEQEVEEIEASHSTEAAETTVTIPKFIKTSEADKSTTISSEKLTTSVFDDTTEKSSQASTITDELDTSSDLHIVTESSITYSSDKTQKSFTTRITSEIPETEISTQKEFLTTVSESGTSETEIVEKKESIAPSSERLPGTTKTEITTPMMEEEVEITSQEKTDNS
ncbi:hypothetical protein CEXT_777161 [Caerostris extrusa]|uniref:Uncharacterized protein n=1 Tax=Caerostris extrusa TaxID=172846 RepID=A0AAV4V5U6_CAEEX|nr:hypothetical protein CEXT_777161 [Caerostris extrusa]